MFKDKKGNKQAICSFPNICSVSLIGLKQQNYLNHRMSLGIRHLFIPTIERNCDFFSGHDPFFSFTGISNNSSNRVLRLEPKQFKTGTTQLTKLCSKNVFVTFPLFLNYF